uniref:EF-hand domain-containing protein n=1 Tax=Strigamia maritima TaxID=126957 RepID=T1J5J2_STRMM
MDSNFPAVLAHEKFVDRNPEIKAAGNLTNFGDTVADCLFISQIEPYGYVKRFLKQNIYPIGHSTQLPSRADDPCIGLTLCNGISSYPSEPVVNLIYPPEISKLEFIQNEIAEKNAYPNRMRAAPGLNLPPGATNYQKECDKELKPEDSVGDLLHYPPELMKFCNCKDYRIKIHRDYNEHFDPNRNFGDDHRTYFKDGRIMKNVMFESSLDEKFFPVAYGLEEYRQRNTSKLGESLEPNCDIGVALVDRNHVFGPKKEMSEPVEELLNWKAVENLKTRELLATIFRAISESAFNQFDKFLSICSYFDKAKNGRISVEDLKCACTDTRMPITTVQFMHLLNCCDLITATNTVDYMKFYKIINPDASLVPIDRKSFDQEMNAAAKRFNANKTSKKQQFQTNQLQQMYKRETCEPIEMNEENGRAPIDTVTKKIDAIMERVNTKKTTLHEINSNVAEINTKAFRTFGHPLIRSDHPPPNTHKIGDSTNYGDDSDAYACLYPSIYTQNGISKFDMLKSRSKGELFEIFKKVYPTFTMENFSSLYQMAAKQSCDCTVSVEGIKQCALPLSRPLHYSNYVNTHSINESKEYRKHFSSPALRHLNRATYKAQSLLSHILEI